MIGSTVHWITDGTIDTGPIVGLTEVAVEPRPLSPGSHPERLSSGRRTAEGGDPPAGRG